MATPKIKEYPLRFSNDAEKKLFFSYKMRAAKVSEKGKQTSIKDLIIAAMTDFKDW